MEAKHKVEVVDVTKDNVEETGFFCCMSKEKSEGYQRKLRWLRVRFEEGLQIKMLKLPERGFIEYILGEYAWRPVSAKGYMFIHCIWVVGKSRGKGYATYLLHECIKDAKVSRMKGVAMVTSEGNWLIGKKLLNKHGFESADQAPPSFNLMVKKFGRARSPSFNNSWGRKQKKLGKGLLVYRTDQCPYLDDATNIMLATAEELGIKGKVIELRTNEEVCEKSPSAYGVFGAVYDKALLSYEYLLKKEIMKRLAK